MRTTSTLALALVASSLSAQLQNGGFEVLSSLDMPAYWTTGIELVVIGDSVVVDSAKYLLNTTDVHSGVHAAELRNSYNFTQGLGSPGVWFASPFEEGYQGFPSPNVPVVERPQTVRFWAKYAPIGGDSAYVEVKVISEPQKEIGFGALRIGGLVDTYTAFEVPIAYTSPDSAAYINIRFVTIAPGNNPHLGTRMLIDDVEIEYMATGIAEVDATPLRLSPNPATSEVRITGLSVGPTTTAKVLDATGRVVLTRPLTNGQLSLEGAAAGTYLVQLEQGGALFHSRLVITH